MVRVCNLCRTGFDDEVNLSVCPHDIVTDPLLPRPYDPMDCIIDLVRTDMEDLISEDIQTSTPWWRLMGES